MQILKTLLSVFIFFLLFSINISAVDAIQITEGPSNVSQGETVTIKVEYAADIRSDIYVQIQYNHAPWTSYTMERVTV